MSSIVNTSVKVTTDATEARTGLAKFGGEVRQWANQQQKALGGMGNAALRGGLIGGFLGGSLQGVLQEAIKNTLDLALGVTKVEQGFERAQERAGQLNSQIRSMQDRKLADMATELASLANDPGAAIGRMTTQIPELKKQLQGATSAAAAARSELEDLAPTKSVENFLLALSPFDTLKKLGEGPKASLNEANASAEKLRGTISQLEIAQRKLRMGAPDLALTGDLKKMMTDLDFEGRTRNMSPNERLIEQLRDRESKSMRAGGKSQANEFAELIDKLKSNEFGVRQDAATKAFDELRQQLQDAKEFAGRTSEEVAVLKLEREATELAAKGLQGITNDQSRQLRALLPDRPPPWLATALDVVGQVTDLTKNAPKFEPLKLDNAALQKGSSAEVSARMRNEFGNQSKDQLAEARKANTNLKAVEDAVKGVGDKLGAGGVLLPI